MYTLEQFTAHKNASILRRHPHAEPEDLMSESFYNSEWRDYVVREFNNGETMSVKFWSSLDESLQYRILRTPRALKDDALTRSLVKTRALCACSDHSKMLCPKHADVDPCLSMSLVTGKRRKGTIRNGTCSNCGWQPLNAPLSA